MIECKINARGRGADPRKERIIYCYTARQLAEAQERWAPARARGERVVIVKVGGLNLANDG